jgi:hypothetical protein
VQIDHSFRKDTIHPPRWGYQARGNALPSSILIHTTNNKHKHTQFVKEAEFLRDSPAVSAHFLIGKDGRIVQFLDPIRWQAWHAGKTLPAFLNAKSIGIEHHVSVGEDWTATQHEACTWLVRTLMSAHTIPSELVETHRAVALPKKRKSDPEGWEDAAFDAWRATLVSSPPSPLVRTVKAGPRGAIAQQDRRPDAPTAGLWYPPGSWIQVDDLTSGYWHATDHTGFIPRGQVEE